MAKGMSTTTLLLIGGGLIGGYFLLSKTGVLGNGGLSAADEAILNALADQRQASAEQRQFMMELAQKQQAAAPPGVNIWENPETYTGILDSVFAGIGVFV